MNQILKKSVETEGGLIPIRVAEPLTLEMTFIPAVFTQVYLPKQRLTQEQYEHINGEAMLFIQAGSLEVSDNNRIDFPVPYGAMARLIICDIAAYAAKKKTRVIDLEKSASKYLKRLGLDNQGLRHEALHLQISALAACSFQFSYQGNAFNGHPIANFGMEMDTSNGKTKRVWPKSMTLSEGFYQSITNNLVPLDHRALKALKGSALSFDIYVWAVQRLFRLQGVKVLYWSQLRRQFAPNYGGSEPHKNFKKKFKQALEKVLAVYPMAKMEVVQCGIRLTKSPPPIPISRIKLHVDNKKCG